MARDSENRLTPMPIPPHPRIACYIRLDFHHAVIDPVYALLSQRWECLLSGDLDAIAAFAPHVILTTHGDHDFFRQRLPGAVIVFVRHGFATKNVFRRAVRDSDFACMSSEWTCREATQQGVVPQFDYWATGFVPLDPFFRNEIRPREELIPASLPPVNPTLLYAPTYNPEMNSVAVLDADWIHRVHASLPLLNILIKPHPVIPERSPEWMTQWRDAARQISCVHLVEEAHTNVYEFMPHTQIMISDASSVIFYYLAVDRPIILIDNPHRATTRKYYDPDGPEWKWRDVGESASSSKDLPELIQAALTHPGLRKEQRQVYRERVLGGLTDGRAAERIAEKVSSLFQITGENRDWVESVWTRVNARRQKARPKTGFIGKTLMNIRSGLRLSGS